MPPRAASSRWSLPLALGMAVLATWWLVSRVTRERQGPLAEQAPDPAAGHDAGPADLELAPSSDDSGRTASASDSEPRTKPPGPTPPRIRFAYGGGEPAAGVGLYPAHVEVVRAGTILKFRVPTDPDAGPAVGIRHPSLRSFPFDLGLLRGSPVWSIQTDEHGVVEPDSAEKLGPVAAARISGDAVVILPVRLDQEEPHILPSVVSQEVVLADAPSNQDIVLEAELRSADLFGFLHGGEQFSAPLKGFADDHLVLARSLEAPRIAAWRLFKLTQINPVMRMALPQGSYEIRVSSCTFGWWVQSRTFEAGEPLTLLLYRPPIAYVSVLDPATDEPRIPRQVRLYDLKETPTIRSSSEQDIPWEVSDNRIAVAIVRGRPEPGVRYGLKVTWATGEEQLTELRPWEGLAAVLNLQGE